MTMEDVVQETTEVWQKYETTHSPRPLLLADHLALRTDRPRILQKPTPSVPLSSS